MHTQIRFSYIFSTAYHVIVETYAQWCADMCAGPGSTGRVRDTWCTEKILLILLLLSLFLSVFLKFPLCRVVLFTFDSVHDISSHVPFPPVLACSNQTCWCPLWFSVSNFNWPLQCCLVIFSFLLLSTHPCFLLLSARNFFFCSPSVLHFSAIALCVLKQVAQRLKDVFKENKTPWQLRICLGSRFWANSIPPFCITHCSDCLTFSQLPRFLFPSLFFLSFLHRPPSFLFLLSTLPSFLFPYFMTPSFQIPPPHFSHLSFVKSLALYPPPSFLCNLSWRLVLLPFLSWKTELSFTVSTSQYPTVIMI